MSLSALFDNFTEDMAAAVLEFIGTAFFLLMGLGGAQLAKSEDFSSGRPASHIEQALYISSSMAFSLLVSAWLFFRVTGGLFNPDVSLALLLVGVIKPVRFVLYCIAQLLGAVAGAALLRGLTGKSLDPVNTSLHADINLAQGIFMEIFMTSVLILSVLMLSVEKHQVTPFAPVGVGLTIFATHLFASHHTGASMNTARSFGPAVITEFSASHHWVYWLGPFLGSLLGTAFYATLKRYRYWTLNPDQATTDTSKSPQDPTVTAMRKLRMTDSKEEKREEQTSDSQGGTRQVSKGDHNV